MLAVLEAEGLLEEGVWEVGVIVERGFGVHYCLGIRWRF